MIPLPGVDHRDLIDIIASGLFDEQWYATTYPDVAVSGVDPLWHFNHYGWHEGRDPSPFFSVAHYLQQHPDVADAGANPLAHYLRAGWREGRSPRPGFDPAEYVTRFGLAPDVCPLVHEAARCRADTNAS